MTDTPTPQTDTPADALSLGADTPPSGEWDFVPEKFRVTDADGKFDAAGALRKIVEPYSHLEKRLGSGAVPPKEAKDYAIAVPESLKDKLDAAKLATDEKFQAYVAKCHEAGMTQAQFDVAVGSNLELAVEIADGMAAESVTLTKDACIAALRGEWQSDEQLKEGLRASYRGLYGAVGQELGDTLRGKYGNDPDFVKAWAAIGREMKEDRPANTTGAGGATADDINALMMSEAYQNPRHLEHAKVSAQVRAHFAAKYPGQAA